MKNISFLLILGILVMLGCQPATGPAELPTDLTELRDLEKAKKAELKTLTAQLNKIEMKIDSLDVNKVVQRRLVTIKTIETQSFVHFTKVQGSIETDETVSVSSEMGGRITALYLTEGQLVKKGALVAKTDMENVNKQKSEIQTQLDLAKDLYQRQSTLWEQNIGSEIQYLQAKNNVDRLEKTLETLDFQLTKANLYAPISGVVDIVHLKSGETASPGMPIATIFSNSQVKVVADIPENYLGKIDRGEKVIIYLPALQDTIIAKVSLMGRKIDPANRTFKIEIDVPNRNGKLKPNLLAEVTFEDYQKDDVIVVSQAMVQQEITGKEFVFTVGEKEGELAAKKNYVKTGETYDGKVIIENGLTAGDQLIDEGGLGLSEKELITVINPINETANR